MCIEHCTGLHCYHPHMALGKSSTTTKNIESVIMIIPRRTTLAPIFKKKTVIVLCLFSHSFPTIWVARNIMKQILVNFVVNFKQNDANGGRNLFQQIRGERPALQAQIC